MAIAVVLPLTLALGPAEAGRLVQTRDIKNKAVTTAKIAPKAVKGSKLAPNAVNGSKLKNNAVNGSKLKNNAVSSAKIADGSVGAGDLSPALRIFSSEWLPAASGPDETFDGTNLDIATVAAPEITQDVRDSDAVSVYMAFAGKTLALPYTSFAGGKPNTVGFRIEVGQIVLTRMSDDNVASLGFSGALRFRYVISPSATGGGTPPAAALRGGSSVD